MNELELKGVQTDRVALQKESRRVWCRAVQRRTWNMELLSTSSYYGGRHDAYFDQRRLQRNHFAAGVLRYTTLAEKRIEWS